MSSPDAAAAAPAPRGALAAVVLIALVPFAVLATANSAGYRYGASDQAFYVPAVLEAINPALFPRDSGLIHSQANLTAVDEVIGGAATASGVSLPTAFAAFQVLTLGLLAAGIVSVGSLFYRTRWALAGLLLLETLRHAISKSGTNTLEGYFHPRQLAFALGTLALGAFLRGRHAAVWLLLAAAGLMHPTTCVWFAIWLAIATFVTEPRRRPQFLVIGAAAAIAAVWVLTAGPLSGRLARMDDEWLATLAAKDYLLPGRWPVAAWLANLAYVPVIAAIYRYRKAHGALVAREAGLVAGCLALVVVFLAVLPFNAARMALAIQLQPARIFWMVDFLAAVYVVWALAEGLAPKLARARAVAALLAVISIARGAYIMTVEFPERPLAEVGIGHDDWERAIGWATRSEPDSVWLADPMHAARYGSSLRLAGRDVFVEGLKDSAIGMYDREVALRTRDRLAEIGEFTNLTPERARQLAAAHDLDYLVTESRLALPEAFSSGRIRIYRLQP